MPDNQFDRLFDLVTKSVKGVQSLEKGQAELKAGVAELKTEVAELKTDVGELEQGQMKLVKEMQIVNKSLIILHSDSLNIRAGIEILEQEKEAVN